MIAVRSVVLLLVVSLVKAFLNVDGFGFENSGSLPSLRAATKGKSCAVSVCFGIDGSELTRTQFERQKKFFEDILKRLSKKSGVSVAAVEYGIANEKIFDLGSNVASAAQKAASIKFRGDELSSLSAPIVYCDSVLRQETNRTSRIVLFSSGKSSIGGDPTRRAQVFRERSKGDIVVISLDRKKNDLLDNVARGDSDTIITLDNDDYSPELNEVVDKICM